ncbi:hypothetical protein AMECASPLE_019371 [Ameca splendens]|uniref:Uncharacterized protein n=1 Tax=Ameca splendens TaxID=208324 RepID=A0ABV0YQK3_9TELE
MHSLVHPGTLPPTLGHGRGLCCRFVTLIFGSMTTSSAASFQGEPPQMNGPAGCAPPTGVLGLNVSRLWHCGSIQRNGHQLSGSVQPGLRSRAPVRLPSLVAATKGPRRQGSMAHLSVSKLSLLTPGQDVLSERFSGTQLSSILQIRSPPPPFTGKASTLLPCKSCMPAGSRDQQQSQHLQNCSRPDYIHFSRAIQPTVRPGPVRRHSHIPPLSSDMLHADLRRRNSSSSQEEALSVVGKPCFLSCNQRPAAGPPGRAQLHVFLPSETEGEEGDGESVDEGFMDELDSKITSLKLQQKVIQTITNHS